MSDTATSRLRADAEGAAAALPPLLLQAEYLANTVLLGTHGRRRAGLGDEFWQYRPYQQGDSRRMIDWRRSARGDQQFVRQREWQSVQTATLWVDGAASMQFASHADLPQKHARAQLLALALAALLLRGGEPVGLAGVDLPPRRGRAQLLRLAQHFIAAADAGRTQEYGLPEARAMLPRTNAVFLSDFLGDLAPLEAALAKAAERGVRGVLLQVLDPAEEAFPYQGRVSFESVAGSLCYETRQAGGLRDRYLQRLADRKERLRHLAQAAAWQYHCHHTDQPAQAALIWIWQALSTDRGAV